jgi:hypothetical protein
MARRTPSPSTAKGAESPPGNQSPRPDKETINLRLPKDALTRLKVHCAIERSTASDVVRDLIMKDLPTYEELISKEPGVPKAPARKRTPRAGTG